MSGLSSAYPKIVNLPILQDYNKKGDRAQFLKSRVRPEGVELLEGQSSFILSSFAVANALIYIPAYKNSIKKGELVETHLLG